jgi:dehydrogenase/reductase SDR family protein 7B
MLKDKVAIITGSTQGIGKRVALRLAEHGAIVVINSRSAEKVEKTVAEFTTKGHRVFGVNGDVSDYTFCEDMRNQIIARYGRIDILINNAAIAVEGSISKSSAKAIEKATRSNIHGSIHPTIAFMDDLTASKGSVLFISSIAGIAGLPGFAMYSCTKKAIFAIAESVKNELVDHGVFVGVCLPDFTENEASKEIMVSNGEIQSIPKRKGIKTVSLDRTASCIIAQLKTKRFLYFTSWRGRTMYCFYRFFPGLFLFVLKVNRKRFMK